MPRGCPTAAERDNLHGFWRDIVSLDAALARLDREREIGIKPLISNEDDLGGIKMELAGRLKDVAEISPYDPGMTLMDYLDAVREKVAHTIFWLNEATRSIGLGVDMRVEARENVDVEEGLSWHRYSPESQSLRDLFGRHFNHSQNWRYTAVEQEQAQKLLKSEIGKAERQYAKLKARRKHVLKGLRGDALNKLEGIRLLLCDLFDAIPEVEFRFGTTEFYNVISRTRDLVYGTRRRINHI